MKTALTAALMVGMMAVGGCTSPETARRVLDDAGYKNVVITGYRPFGCGSNDEDFHTGFKAIAPSGKTVTGTVCRKMFISSSVIRID